MSVVLRERRGRVEILTLNRPEARNAINAEVTEAMTAALDDIDNDNECWAIVLTGAGDKAFCAGMDLKAFASGGMGGISAKGGFAGITQREVAKPLIAAVNGHALAGGLEIMLSCDLVVAAREATFGIPEVKRGLMAAAGGVIRLPKRVSMAMALELAMTGDAIDADRALQLGLVNRVVDREQVVEEAVKLAERICENAPNAVRISKKVVKAAAEVSEEEAWKISNEGTAEVMRSPNALEGARAFAEKRAPDWKVD